MVVTVDPEFSGVDFVSAITWAGVRHVFADGEHVADAQLAVKDMGLGSIMGTRRGKSRPNTVKDCTRLTNLKEDFTR